MPFPHRAVLLLALAGAATACTDSSRAPTAPAATDDLSSRSSATQVRPTSGPFSLIATGETGPGALYRVFVPTAWNGDLVTMAHPIRDALAPVTLSNELYMDSLTTWLGTRGYAVAYSSYSRNGFAVKDGALRTHQLRGLVTRFLPAPPTRHYLVGFSLGSAVSLSLIEQYPTQYDGALLLCGMVGGSLTETQYLGHVRSLFDVAYPGVLLGSTLQVPFNYLPNAGALQTAILGDPRRLFTVASIRQTPLPYVPGMLAVPTMIESGITALTFHARGINDITALVNGKVPFGNVGEQYTIGTIVQPAIPIAPMITALAQGFDTTVARYRMDVSAANYLAKHYTPTGRLQVPVITVHNQWDPIVPVFHEDTLRRIVTDAGYAQNLMQIRLPQYGHCAQLGVDKSLPAWLLLEQWVRAGARP
jgi:predicted esterase